MDVKIENISKFLSPKSNKTKKITRKNWPYITTIIGNSAIRVVMYALKNDSKSRAYREKYSFNLGM